MTTRARDLTRAAAAAALLVALIIGVPVALTFTVGNPLPQHVPAWSVVNAALRGDEPVPDAVWINLLAALVWIAWARLVVGVAVETITTIRHRPRALAVHGGRTQRSIGTLVATAALLYTLVHRPPIVSTTPPLPKIVLAADLAPNPSPTAPTGTSAQTASAGSSPTWTVQRRDSLWRIADRTLGDGRRYTDIYELNRGHPQPDGGTLQDPSLIRPGWILQLPADAALPDNTIDHVTVAAGDTLSTIAQNTLGDADRWPDIAAVNHGIEQADGTTLEDPNLIRPGWHLTIPRDPTTGHDKEPSPAPNPSPPPLLAPPSAPAMPMPTAPTRPTPAAPSITTPSPPAEHPADDSGLVRTVALTLLPASTAAVLLWALRRRRRARLAYRQPTEPIVTPPPDEQQTERALRTIADADAADWIDVTTRLLTKALRAHSATATPVALRPGAFGVEVLLDQPCPPPTKWFATDDNGSTWRLRPDLELDDLRHATVDEPPATPALVTIGSTPEGPVLLNLEHAGAIAIAGDPERVTAFLNAIAIELAHAPWTAANTLLIDDRLCAASVDRAQADDAAHIVDTITKTAAATAAALPPDQNAFVARIATDATELWPPTIAVLANADAGVLSEVPPHIAVAAVAAGGGASPRWRMHIDHEGRARLHPLDLDLIATGVADDDLQATLKLLASADGIPAPDASATAPPHNNSDHAVAGATSAQSSDARRLVAEALAVSPIEVKVLQPTPQVTGWADAENLRTKSTEIVTYLAIHGAVRTDRLRADLWTADVTYNTVKTAVARTRTALGTDATGARHLREAVEGSYQLSPDVACDWHRFTTLVASARRTADDAEAVELLTGALELVTGRPFSSAPRGHYGWSELDGTINAIEVAVSDTAERLAQLALARHDTEQAAWAIGKGQLATPDQLTLFETKMATCGMAGDIRGVKQAYTEAQRIVCDLDALNTVPDSTVAAYEQAMQTAHAKPRARAAS